MARKLIVKSDFNLSTGSNPADGYKYIGYKDGVYSQREGSTVTPIAPYTEWTAEIIQSAQNAPSVTVIKNTMGITVTPSRAGSGQYLLSGFTSPNDGSNLLSGSNHVIENHLSLASYLHHVVFTTEGSNSIGIGTYDTDVFSDGVLISTDTLTQYISVKIYN